MKLFCDERPADARALPNALETCIPFEPDNRPPPGCDCLGGWMVEERLPRPLNVEEEPSGVPANGCDPNPAKGGNPCPDDP